MPLQLTTFQLSLLVILVVATFLFFVLGVLWIRRKYPRAERFNAYLVSFMLIIGVYIIGMLSVAIGIYTTENLKKVTPYFGIALLVAWLMVFIVLYYKRKPIPTEKLWVNYVMPAVKWRWEGRIYTGRGYGTSIKFTKVIKTTQHPYLKQVGADVVEAFYCMFFSSKKFMALMVHDKFSGHEIFTIENPTYDIVLSTLGREAVSVYEQGEQEMRQEKQQQEQEKGVYLRE